ncbi:MAG: acyl-CoA dehydrogenase family protein [Rhodocyclaceae bacterium]|nr:acyl-CoA dehydrogenase family protein [Rhodocyclaceae bacterium]
MVIQGNEVLNQPPPLVDYNPYVEDVALREAVQREGAGWAEQDLIDFGALLGQAEVLRHGDQANRNVPELRAFDRQGRRVDLVEYHPSWHALMQIGIGARNHSLPWIERRPGSQVVRAAMNMLRHQVDEGTSCPISMTYAAMPTLSLEPAIAHSWAPRMLSSEYDPRDRPMDTKKGVLVGMAMTERQGGSDVRANIAMARPLDKPGRGECYVLEGHKWFCSAPASDAFLTLANTAQGLSCFLLPRWRPDGLRNAFHIQRLKDKLGNRSNASGEVEFHGAWAYLIGEPGRGIANIMEMVRLTRLDCVWGSAATLRRAVAEATHYCRHRQAFGRALSEQPLMQSVLADLALESEAATALALRVARAVDRSDEDESERLLARIAIPAAKFWVTHRAIAAVAEAMECFGGNGFVEEVPLARLYRDIPVNAIWEGSGNVQCLDVLRALSSEPDARDALLDELTQARGDPDYDRLLVDIEGAIAQGAPEAGQARRLTESIALALQAGLLGRYAPGPVADGFHRARLAASVHKTFGSLPPDIDRAAIIARATPRG